MTATMLILPGITDAGGMHNPHGLLDRDSAREYARRKGYVGRVLEVSDSHAGADTKQVKAALQTIQDDDEIVALYGFSGGGYNARYILNALGASEQARIRLVVILGAPNNPASAYDGPWDLIYRKDPPSPNGHMDGPKVLLAELGPQTGPVVPA